MKNCLFIILLIASFCKINAQTSQGVDVSSGLQAFWKFNEGSGSSIADFSGNNHNSVSCTNATWPQGKSGTSIGVDSATIIDLGISNLELNNEITVSYWVYFEADNGRFYTRSIMYKGVAVYPFVFQTLGNSYPKTIRVITRTESGTDNLSSTTKVSANTWYHIVLTYKQGEKRLYIDGGVNASTANCTGSLVLEKNRALGIGKDPANLSNNSIKGRIDELKIYDRALSENEIKALYDGTGLDVTAPNPVDYVNDGTGNDMDSTGSINSISANWSKADDPESNITKYYYAIGTAPGLTDIVNWTNNQKALSFLKTNLNLLVGTKYYVTVKAENSSGLQSVPISSNGIKVINLQYPNLIGQVKDSRSSGNPMDLTIKQNMSSLTEIKGDPYSVPSAGLYTWRDSWRSGNYGFVNEIHETGLKSIRVGSYYYEMLRDDEMQNLAVVARNDNIKTMFTILGKQRLQTGEFTEDQQFIDSYLVFVDSIIGRFGPHGKFFAENPSVPYEPILYWEIWNEPDLYYMLGNEHANDLTFAEKANLYSKLLMAAYSHIRSKPEWDDIKVVAMSIAGVGDETPRFAELVHAAVAANGGDPAKCYDILSIHPYTHDCPSDIEDIMTNTSGVINYTYSLINETYKVRENMSKWGNSNKPVWYTEVGWSRYNGPNPNGRPFPVTERQQAAYLARLYAMAIRLGIEQVHVMFVIDGDGSNSGFFYRNQETKEVTIYEQAKAAKVFNQLMPVPKITSAISDGDMGYYAYWINPNVDDPQSQPLIMAWNAGGPLTINIPGDTTKNYLIVDLFGNTQKIAAQNSQIEIPVGPCPVYVVKGTSLPVYALLRTPEELTLVSVDNNIVNISWKPSSSSDIVEYLVFRDGKEIATVTGTTWTDKDLNYDTNYKYFVVAKNSKGVKSRPSNEICVKTKKELLSTPKNLMVLDNIKIFPNPVNNIFKIEFYLPQSSLISLNICNMSGQKVLQIEKKHYNAGINSINLDLHSTENGVYFVTLRFDNLTGSPQKSLKFIKQ